MVQTCEFPIKFLQILVRQFLRIQLLCQGEVTHPRVVQVVEEVVPRLNRHLRRHCSSVAFRKGLYHRLWRFSQRKQKKKKKKGKEKKRTRGKKIRKRRNQKRRRNSNQYRNQSVAERSLLFTIPIEEGLESIGLTFACCLYISMLAILSSSRPSHSGRPSLRRTIIVSFTILVPSLLSPPLFFCSSSLKNKFE